MIDNFALIIGAMKCGTTSLFSYLAQHPQISPCNVKEPRFFSNDHRWAEGFEWYQNLWNWEPTTHTIALEASVDYTRIPARPNAAERISTLKDQATFKFIYILRNPIERIESHYTHGQALGWTETQKPLSEGVNTHLIEVSQYARQIEEYYKRFSTDSILLLNFENLKTNPHSLLRGVCQFLDIDPEYNFQGIDTVYNANNQRLVDERLWKSMSRMKSNVKLLDSMIKLIPTKQKQMIYSYLGRKRESNIQIPPEQRSIILGELRQDLRKLSLEYGVDVSLWGIEV